jgi:hypothetical protein
MPIDPVVANTKTRRHEDTAQECIAVEPQRHGDTENTETSHCGKEAKSLRLDGASPHVTLGEAKGLPIEARALVDVVWRAAAVGSVIAPGSS